MSAEPSPNGDDGQRPQRDERGRFVVGWRGGPGNPFARRVADLRTELLTVVTPERLRKIVEALVASAETGDVVAAREVLNRTIGLPSQTDVLQRLEALEEIVGGRL